VEIGYGIYVEKKNSELFHSKSNVLICPPLYCLVGFQGLIANNDISLEISLPEAVKGDKNTGRQEKTIFSELEVSSAKCFCVYYSCK